MSRGGFGRGGGGRGGGGRSFGGGRGGGRGMDEGPPSEICGIFPFYANSHSVILTKSSSIL